MRMLLPIALFVLPLTACTHGGSGVSPITDQPKGHLKITSEKKVTNAAFDSGSCSNLNPLIKVGTSESIAFSEFAGDRGQRSIQADYQVVSVEPSNNSFVTRLSGQIVRQHTGKASVQFNCRLSTQDDGTVCDSPDDNESNDKPTTDETCYINNENDSSIIVGDGTLELANDRKTVNVHEIKAKGSGELFCNDKDTGMTATTESVMLFSKDVPQLSDQEGQGCQSEPVFMYQKIVDARGNIRLIHRSEVLSLTVPQR